MDMPCEIFPPDTGLIVADAFGAQTMREAPEHRLPAATRKSMMLLFARAAALRLQSLADPNGPYGEIPNIYSWARRRRRHGGQSILA